MCGFLREDGTSEDIYDAVIIICNLFFIVLGAGGELSLYRAYVPEFIHGHQQSLEFPFLVILPLIGHLIG